MIDVTITDDRVVFTPVINDEFYNLRDIYYKAEAGAIDVVYGAQASVALLRMQDQVHGQTGSFMMTNNFSVGEQHYTLLYADGLIYHRPGIAGQVSQDLFSEQECTFLRGLPEKLTP